MGGAHGTDAPARRRGAGVVPRAVVRAETPRARGAGRNGSTRDPVERRARAVDHAEGHAGRIDPAAPRCSARARDGRSRDGEPARGRDDSTARSTGRIAVRGAGGRSERPGARVACGERPGARVARGRSERPGARVACPRVARPSERPRGIARARGSATARARLDPPRRDRDLVTRVTRITRITLDVTEERIDTDDGIARLDAVLVDAEGVLPDQHESVAWCRELLSMLREDRGSEGGA